MTLTPVAAARTRTIGRLALVAATLLAAACGSSPTAPAAPAAARAAEPAGPVFMSGYMLSSGRDHEHGHDEH